MVIVMLVAVIVVIHGIGSPREGSWESTRIDDSKPVRRWLLSQNGLFCD